MLARFRSGPDDIARRLFDVRGGAARVSAHAVRHRRRPRGQSVGSLVALALVEAPRARRRIALVYRCDTYRTVALRAVFELLETELAEVVR
jgi:hypothetical protein